VIEHPEALLLRLLQEDLRGGLGLDRDVGALLLRVWQGLPNVLLAAYEARHGELLVDVFGLFDVSRVQLRRRLDVHLCGRAQARTYAGTQVRRAGRQAGKQGKQGSRSQQQQRGRCR